MNQNNIQKYQLDKYKDFNILIQNNELSNIYKIDYKVKTLKDDYYEKSFKEIEKYKNEEFKTKIQIKDFDINEYEIDNFYIASFNCILASIQIKITDLNKNFYNNICYPLFNGDKVLFQAINLFYNPQKYEEIKNIYNINSNNITPILFGYRYCLNELFYKNSEGIYYPLYERSTIYFLKYKYYPGNDTINNLVYSQIVNHFKTKSDEGCYVCLCQKWYYHSVPSGFPSNAELNMICPKCLENIGAEKKGKELQIVKRENYYRIFKDEQAINKVEKSRLNEINYMTLEKFKEKYILKEYQKKGVYITDKNSFKNDNKIIRNLSQISYRLLNFILYSHLFFARILTGSKFFDKYLPKYMNWEDTIYECWIILKNELLKENISSIEEFMHYIFVNLSSVLNQEKL